MKRLFLAVLMSFGLLVGNTAFAVPLDLSGFSADPGVTIDGSINAVTFEETGDIGIFLYNGSFSVPTDALSLNFDYALILGPDDPDISSYNDDYLVAQIDTNDDGYMDYPDDYYLEIGSFNSDPFSGSWSIDLTSFTGKDIWIAFGLDSSAEWPDVYGDYPLGTVATLSNLELVTGSAVVATPEPGTMILLGLGLISLAGFGRKKIAKI